MINVCHILLYLRLHHLLPDCLGKTRLLSLKIPREIGEQVVLRLRHPVGSQTGGTEKEVEALHPGYEKARV
jgi:hypothetical protein